VQPKEPTKVKVANNETVYEIEYENDSIILLREENEGMHRLEDKSQFEKELESGWFETVEEQVVPEATVETSEPEDNEQEKEATGENNEIELLSVGGVGEQTAQNLKEGGYNEAESISKARLGQLKAVNGVGTSTAKNLQEAAQNV